MGPLFVHPGPQAWHVLESPQLQFVNGRYHLFFTEQNVPSTSYLSAPDLTGPWNYAQKVYFDANSNSYTDSNANTYSHTET